MKRLIPSLPFPSYVFIPGVNPHPKKEGGHMEDQSDPVAEKIEFSSPEQSDFLRYSIDLLNHGYFWESHVYFEALWNAHGRIGSTANFLKGMIKLGAAGVKININQKESAKGHFLRAKELFEIVMNAEGQYFLGFDLQHLIRESDHLAQAPSTDFHFYPEWD